MRERLTTFIGVAILMYIAINHLFVSRRCAIPEVIADEAYLFDNTVDDLHCAVERCRSLGNRDFKAYFQNKFSQNVILEQYRKFYARLLSKK